MGETDIRLSLVPSTLAGTQLLLQHLTKRFPPLARHAHSLTLHEGKLQLSLVHVTPCERVILDAEDLQKPVGQLVLEISLMVPREPPETVA